ncbi:MAG: tRNA (adenosine(37)-N6)-threonylcarbamoyltransferase complex transferase subunit TsaD [Bifidobacteriaceae bacterium]|jgi:N6-L-threonylcarbamoyladenine synthase|nr:tRNA (adenosine(37)-N6)-threonylcarbamoyltransferase complex transferase subunit TsaD [Bifidobacteriaceae bacterium]
MSTILGVESTCDETGIGIVKDGISLANCIASSADEHARWGGVIPEIASRAHLEALEPTLNRALEKANISLSEIDAVSVAAGPGLAGCLAVGASYAKGLAYALQVPLFGVNHVIAHIFAGSLSSQTSTSFTSSTSTTSSISTISTPSFPESFIGLVVSGGHTSIIKKAGEKISVIGSTTDDAAGECFDKVGRLLGLDYPAGEKIDRLAKDGDPNFVDFPKGYTQKKHYENHRFDFSFSGLKTAVARFLESNENQIENVQFRKDVSAALAKSVSEVLVDKTLDAAKFFEIDSIVIGGGFSANSQLREKFKKCCTELDFNLFIPPLDLCTDNGAMIAKLGEILFEKGAGPSPLDFSIDSSMPLTRLKM